MGGLYIKELKLEHKRPKGKWSNDLNWSYWHNRVPHSHALPYPKSVMFLPSQVISFLISSLTVVTGDPYLIHPDEGQRHTTKLYSNHTKKGKEKQKFVRHFGAIIFSCHWFLFIGVRWDNSYCLRPTDKTGVCNWHMRYLWQHEGIPCARKNLTKITSSWSAFSFPSHNFKHGFFFFFSLFHRGT